MTYSKVFALLLLAAVFSSRMYADGKQEFQKYLNDVAVRVKAAPEPAQKRTILNKAFHDVSKAFEVAQQSPLVSDADRNAIRRLDQSVREKEQELNGSHGFARVADNELNAFADYTLQDLEQADQYVTISITALLIILIIVLLVAR